MSFIAELENTWAKLPEGGYTILHIQTVNDEGSTVENWPDIEQARNEVITFLINNEFGGPFKMEHIEFEYEVEIDGKKQTLTLSGYPDAKCSTLEQARHRLLNQVIVQYSEFIVPFQNEQIQIDVDYDNDTFTLTGYSDDVSDEVRDVFDAFMAKNTLTAEEFKNLVNLLTVPEDYLNEYRDGSFLIR